MAAGDLGKYISEGLLGKKQEEAEFAYYDADRALNAYTIKEADFESLKLEMNVALAKLEKHCNWPVEAQTIVFRLLAIPVALALALALAL